MENILFGLPYNKKKFDEIVKCCALEDDFETFPNGASSTIGDKGINLSGGQRARIGFNFYFIVIMFSSFFLIIINNK